MTHLTDKQVANRAYYRQNAEKIRAQKRAAYREKVAASGASVRVKRHKPVLKPKPCPVMHKSARQRIEDYHLYKKLGVDPVLLQN